MFLFLAFRLVFFFVAAWATTTPSLESVSQSQYWHRLMHYKPRLFGGVVSQADGPSFFLSPEGKVNPLAELEANIAAFAPQNTVVVGPLKQHPQCAFPERFRFLNETLKLNIKNVPCPEFDAWHPRFNPQSVTVVFASAYLNNPASMFGHTFLRIDSAPRPGHTQKNDLLDYGVNYAANAGNDGGVTFAFLGLTGGYPGYFSLLPYFEKIKEYVDSESRDLWEYRLSLTPEEIRRMIFHIWELGTTYFDYYFLDENCSYHLLSLLEVAKPEWDLTSGPALWVIPADTVRRITNTPGAVADVTFRPSLERTLIRRLSLFTDQEQIAFKKVSANNYTLDNTESAFALDALLEHLKYRKLKASDDILHRLGVARAKRDSDPREARIFEKRLNNNRPDSGLKTTRTFLFGGSWAKNPFVGLEIRPAFHGLVESDDGYLRNSEISLLRLQIRRSFNDQAIRVTEARVVEVTSVPEVNPLRTPISWAVNFGMRSVRNTAQTIERQDEIRAANLELGAGISHGLRTEFLTAYALTKFSTDYSGRFRDEIRFGPGITAGLLGAIGTRAKLGVMTEFFYYPNQEKDSRQPLRVALDSGIRVFSQLEARFSIQRFWLMGTSMANLSAIEGNGGLAWYF